MSKLLAQEGGGQFFDDGRGHRHDFAERATIDDGLGRRFEDFEPIKGVEDARAADEHAVVLQDCHGVLRRETLGDFEAVAELFAVGNAKDVFEEDVALGNGAAIERRRGGAERRGVDGARADDGPKLGVLPVDRTVEPRGTAGRFAGFAPSVVDDHEVVERDRAAIEAGRRYEELVAGDACREASFGADEQSLLVAATDEVGELSAQFLLGYGGGLGGKLGECGNGA